MDSNSHYVGYDILDNETGKKYYGGRLVQCEELCDFLNEQDATIKKLEKERDSLVQGMIGTAKDSADIITKVWESKHKIPTEKVRYWE